MGNWVKASLMLNVILLTGGLFVVQSLGGVRYLWFRMQHRGVSGLYENRRNFFAVLPSDSNTIVFLGNSITEQGEWAELLGNCRVRNRGIATDGIQGMINRLDAVQRQQPAKIFLMAGVNDLLFHNPSKVLEMYHELVLAIKTSMPETEVVLQSVLPVNNQVRDTGLKNEDIKKVNSGIQVIAKELGCRYIDLFSLLSDMDGRLKANYTADGIHLSGQAYLIWREAILDLVNQ